MWGAISGLKHSLHGQIRVPVPVPKALFMDRWEFRFRFQKLSSWKDEGFRFRSQELHHGQIKGSVSGPKSFITNRWGFCFRSQDIIKDIVHGFRFRSQDIWSWTDAWGFCFQSLVTSTNEFSAGLKTVARWGTPFPVPVISWYVFFSANNSDHLQMRSSVSGLRTVDSWGVHSSGLSYSRLLSRTL
jgi:hypothetical protein